MENYHYAIKAANQDHCDIVTHIKTNQRYCTTLPTLIHNIQHWFATSICTFEVDTTSEPTQFSPLLKGWGVAPTKQHHLTSHQLENVYIVFNIAWICFCRAVE